MTAEDWNRRSVCGVTKTTTTIISLDSPTNNDGDETNLEVLGDLTNETLEGELADEQLSGLLVAPNFTEGDSSGPEAVRLLDTAGGGLRKGKHVQTSHSSTPQGIARNAWKPATHIISSPLPLRECEDRATYRRRRLPGRLGGELLTGGLTWKTHIAQYWGFWDDMRARKAGIEYLPPVDLRAVCYRGRRQRRRRDDERRYRKIKCLPTLVRAIAVQRGVRCGVLDRNTKSNGELEGRDCGGGGG